MPATDEIEFDLLVKRARDAGYYLNRHKTYDPCLEGGDLYIMPRRRFPQEHCETLLRYATADECHEFLNEHT
jgi:hypothetical protein